MLFMLTEAQKEKVLYHLLKAQELSDKLLDPEYELEPKQPTKFLDVAAVLPFVAFAVWLLIFHPNPAPF